MSNFWIERSADRAVKTFRKALKDLQNAEEQLDVTDWTTAAVSGVYQFAADDTESPTPNALRRWVLSQLRQDTTLQPALTHANVVKFWAFF